MKQQRDKQLRSISARTGSFLQGQTWRDGVLVFLIGFSCWAQAQEPAIRPVPILTGSAGYFNNVVAGDNQLVPIVMPVMLAPIGDRWLIESRGTFKAEFERSGSDNAYGGQVEKELDYLQLDYIASPRITVTAGRFLTPFGIYNERLYPIWIRDLQSTPLIFPIGTGSSDGVMVRGGFPLSSEVNFNYATYFSAASEVTAFEAERSVGGRAGVFLTKPRIEVGGSWQKSLEDERSVAVGVHFAWQPPPVPLNLRLEYAHGYNGSGYWIEGGYRLSQIQKWNTVMRRVELVGRMQQFFAGEPEKPGNDEYHLPHSNVQQPDVGLNCYFKDGLKASASYGRWFGRRDYNVWSVGVAYRFAVPLGSIKEE